MRRTISNLQVEALSWRAKQLGVSYGVFSAQISAEEANRICKEFQELLETRKQEEMERLLIYNRSARKCKQQK